MGKATPNPPTGGFGVRAEPQRGSAWFLPPSSKGVYFVSEAKVTELKRLRLARKRPDQSECFEPVCAGAAGGKK